jgi:precorrin-4/cobalt-precorrin-4 C11-methyltransferase
MTVHFIGAGPGAPDLITVRGRDLVMRCPVCLFAGSLVPREVVLLAPPEARVIDTAPLSLDEIEAELVDAHTRGLDVARLHSGDLSIWSAMGEQLRRLRRRNIPYTITPGVPAFAACAAALERELTLPELTQSVVLTRTPGRASSMPPSEALETFAASRATLVVHLSIHVLGDVVARVTPHYGAACPVAIVYHASWPDERVIRGALDTIVAHFEAAQLEQQRAGAPPLERTATILIGPALGDPDHRDSALYDAHYQRRFRGRSPA